MAAASAAATSRCSGVGDSPSRRARRSRRRSSVPVAKGGPGAAASPGRQQAAAAGEPEDAAEAPRRVLYVRAHDGVREIPGIVAHERARSRELRGRPAGAGTGYRHSAQPGPAGTACRSRAAQSGARVASGAGRMPPVSVIVPARDAEATLARALESVLAQDYAGGFEVIVADGSQRAATGALVRRRFPRVRLVPNPGRAIARGLNVALRAARHPIIARCDARAVLPEGSRRSEPARRLGGGSRGIRRAPGAGVGAGELRGGLRPLRLGLRRRHAAARPGPRRAGRGRRDHGGGGYRGVSRAVGAGAAGRVAGRAGDGGRGSGARAGRRRGAGGHAGAEPVPVRYARGLAADHRAARLRRGAGGKG